MFALKPTFAIYREPQGNFRGAAASKRCVSIAQTFALNFAVQQPRIGVFQYSGLGHERDGPSLGHELFRDGPSLGHERDGPSLGHERDGPSLGHDPFRDGPSLGHEPSRGAAASKQCVSIAETFARKFAA